MSSLLEKAGKEEDAAMQVLHDASEELGGLVLEMSRSDASAADLEEELNRRGASVEAWCFALAAFAANARVSLLLGVLAGCRSRRSLAESFGRHDSVQVRVETRMEYMPDTVLLEVLVERLAQVRDTASHLETSRAEGDARLVRVGCATRWRTRRRNAP